LIIVEIVEMSSRSVEVARRPAWDICYVATTSRATSALTPVSDHMADAPDVAVGSNFVSTVGQPLPVLPGEQTY
jgi:hypothetical protein